MKYIKYFEFKDSDLEPIKSFKMKDELNPKVWDEYEIKDDIREKLLRIAQDFYESVDLKSDVIDIILVGSLAGYNWSERYSDYDLHIVIDYTDVNEDIELVKKYCDSVKNTWNKNHDIEIEGYDVEVYIQDKSEKYMSSGVFSLLKDKWTLKPNKQDINIDEGDILEKAKSVMMSVDDLEDNIDNYEYDVFDEEIKKIWQKVKNYRKSGLDEEGGEFSIGNLVFKFLRRNGYIAKIMSLKREAYDNQFK